MLINTDKYDKRQIEEIRLRLMNNLDISIYTNPKYNAVQMYEIRLGIKKRFRCVYICRPKI